MLLPAIAGALLLVCLLALVLLPPLSRVLGIVALLAALATLALGYLALRGAAASTKAGAGDSSHLDRMKKAQEDVLNLLKKSRIHQEELASEIMGTIRLSAGISRHLASVKGRVHGFDEDFGVASKAVLDIRELVDHFNLQVANLAAASEEAAAASEEMAASVERMSKESGNRYDEIKDLAEMSRMGQEEMKTSLSVIRQVSGSVDALNAFIGSINEIADRTSLLAMNAAIQAAHAGEAGRGFAVVAGEVRKLAASSAESAGAISTRLAALIQTIKKAEETSVNSSQLFSIVEERVQRATDSFLEIRNGSDELAIAGREIRDAVSSLKNISSEIRGASAEVGDSVRGVDERIGHLREVSSGIVADLAEAQSSGAEVNLSALATSQSDVAQLQLGETVLEKTRVGLTATNGESSLASILKLQHMAWVSRVRAVLDGKLRLDPVMMGDHHHCDLGKWMLTEGKSALGDGATFAQLDKKHAEMHAMAKEIVTVHQAGKVEEAERLYPELETLSVAIVELLGSVFKKARRAFMSWKKEYEVGNATIDTQHRRLVELINELSDAIDGGSGKEVLGKVLDGLIEYTATHFGAEEAIFSASAYPDVKEHKRRHADLVRQVTELRRNFQTGHAIISADTMAFLKEWLTGHILGTDQAYASYIAKN
jgi:hemerythrin-like metal-binding protein